MDSKSHSLNTHGFSLIEILISIVVLGFVSINTFLITSNGLNTKERVTNEDQDLLSVITFLNRIESDYTEIYSPLSFDTYEKDNSNSQNQGPGISGLDGTFGTNQVEQNSFYSSGDQTFFEGNKYYYGRTKNGHLIPFFLSESKDSITFLSLVHRRRVDDKHQSRFAWIKYSTRPMTFPENQTVINEERLEKIQNLGAKEIIRQIYVDDIFVKDIDWSKVNEQVILQQVKDLEFSFWDNRTKKFTTSLNELNENKTNIRAMKYKLTWINEDGKEIVYEKILRAVWPYYNSKNDQFLMNSTSPNINSPSPSGNSNDAVPPPDGGGN